MMQYKQRDGKVRTAAIELAARSEGIKSEELAALFEKDVGWASRYLAGLTERHVLLRAKLSHKVVRFFTKQKDADAWLTGRRPRVVSAPVSVNAGPPPALLPGEPIIPKGVKIQRCPSPPPRFETVPLLTDRPPVGRSGAEDFRAHQREGRF